MSLAGTGAYAAMQGGTMFSQCISGGGNCSGSGAICGAVFLAVTIVCGVAGAGGAIYGAAKAPSAEATNAVEQSFSRTFSGADAQNTFRDRVRGAAASRGTQLASVPDAKAVLETSSASVEMKTVKHATDPEVALRMTAGVRVLLPGEERELYSAQYSYSSPTSFLSVWVRNASERIATAMTAGFDDLAAQIYEDVFVLFPFPNRKTHSVTEIDRAGFGLLPLYPPLRSPAPTVNDHRLTLRWQEFPRTVDRQAAPEIMNRVTDVRYDLMLSTSPAWSPVGVFTYNRSGLPTAEHKLDAILNPSYSYVWTVRARFNLDGKERVTEWSGYAFPGCAKPAGPSALCSYTFDVQ